MPSKTPDCQCLPNLKRTLNFYKHISANRLKHKPQIFKALYSSLKICGFSLHFKAGCLISLALYIYNYTTLALLHYHCELPQANSLWQYTRAASA